MVEKENGIIEEKLNSLLGEREKAIMLKDGIIILDGISTKNLASIMTEESFTDTELIRRIDEASSWLYSEYLKKL